MARTRNWKNPPFAHEFSGEVISNRNDGRDILQEYLLNHTKPRLVKFLKQRHKQAVATLIFALFMAILGLTAGAVFCLTESVPFLQYAAFFTSGIFFVWFFYLI